MEGGWLWSHSDSPRQTPDTPTASTLYRADWWSRIAIATGPFARPACCRSVTLNLLQYRTAPPVGVSLQSSTHKHKGYNNPLCTYCRENKRTCRNVCTCQVVLLVQRVVSSPPKSLDVTNVMLSLCVS